MNKGKLTITIDENNIIRLSLDESSCTGETERFKVPIKDYIEQFNKSKQKCSNSNIKVECYAYISFHSPMNLVASRKKPYDFAQDALKCDNNRQKEYFPIVHLTVYDKDKGILSKEKENHMRYARIVDSSIWNYYVNIKQTPLNYNKDKRPATNPKYDFTQLNNAIQSIIDNSFYCLHNKIVNLYNLSKSREYADFYARILTQSYLSEEGHGKNVSPYLFHSESKLKDVIEGKQEEITKILKYRWRILLVDDHCRRIMKYADNDNNNANENTGPTKLDIIVGELSKLFGDGKITTKPESTESRIFIDCASSIKDAEDKLSKNKYEIILLDYLLSEGNGHETEYGYKLLDKIWQKEEKRQEISFNYKQGPDNRFYFMFISAFTTAVGERILAENWLRSKKFWYIGEGACPINTPYLFQYRLFNIMRKRMDKMGLLKLNNIKAWLTEDIFGDNPRKAAIEKFEEVLKLIVKYKILSNDVLIPTRNRTIFETEESVMVTDFMMRNYYPENLFEHIVQLVYLTAFGTVRQWPEMWEEYQFIKSVVGRIESIENYITNIKDNSI